MESAKVILALPWKGLAISYLKHWEGMRLVICKNDLLQPKSGSSNLSVPFLLEPSSSFILKVPFSLTVSEKDASLGFSWNLIVFLFVLVQGTRCQEIFANCSGIKHQYISNNIDHIEV